jgi:hypothetical protein
MLVPSSKPHTEADAQSVASWAVEDIETAYHRLLDLGAKPHAEISISANLKHARVVDPFGNIVGIVCTNPDPQSCAEEKQPSETAYNVALARAMAAMDDDETSADPTISRTSFYPKTRGARFVRRRRGIMFSR